MESFFRDGGLLLQGTYMVFVDELSPTRSICVLIDACTYYDNGLCCNY